MNAAMEPITAAIDGPRFIPALPWTVAGFDETAAGTVAVLLDLATDDHVVTGACALMPFPGVLGAAGAEGPVVTGACALMPFPGLLGSTDGGAGGVPGTGGELAPFPGGDSGGFPPAGAGIVMVSGGAAFVPGLPPEGIPGGGCSVGFVNVTKPGSDGDGGTMGPCVIVVMIHVVAADV